MSNTVTARPRTSPLLVLALSLVAREACARFGLGDAVLVAAVLALAPLVALPGAGVVIRDDAKPAIEPMGRCLADVMRRVKEEDPLVALTASDIDRLVNWDAEKYRQTLKP